MGVSRSASSSRETGTTLGAPARAARAPGADTDGSSARVDIDGSFRVTETKKAGLAGTVPLTSALNCPALATFGDRYAGPGPSWVDGCHQRHDHQRCVVNRPALRAPWDIVPRTLWVLTPRVKPDVLTGAAPQAGVALAVRPGCRAWPVTLRRGSGGPRDGPRRRRPGLGIPGASLLVLLEPLHVRQVPESTGRPLVPDEGIPVEPTEANRSRGPRISGHRSAAQHPGLDRQRPDHRQPLFGCRGMVEGIPWLGPEGEDPHRPSATGRRPGRGSRGVDARHGGIIPPG